MADRFMLGEWIGWFVDWYLVGRLVDWFAGYWSVVWLSGVWFGWLVFGRLVGLCHSLWNELFPRSSTEG